MGSRLLCVPAEGSILATFYTGIGDAIINGPIIRALTQAFGGRVVMPDTPGMELLGLASEFRAIRTVPAQFRKLYTLAPADAAATLRSAGVVAVLNFRRDRVAAAPTYGSFAEALGQHGILIRDAADVMPLSEQVRVHAVQFGATFLRSLGIPFAGHDIAWLEPFVSTAVPPVRTACRIGVYLGASVPIKRFSPAFWQEVLRMVAADRAVHFVLIAGLSQAEIKSATLLSEILRAEGVPNLLYPRTSLTRLAELFRGLHGVLTGDSFALALAEAVGVPVVAVHCATDPVVYGVQQRTNRSISSSFYCRCPEKNEVGNCNGWTKGCAHLTCQHHVSASLVASAVRDVIPAGVS